MRDWGILGFRPKYRFGRYAPQKRGSESIPDFAQTDGRMGSRTHSNLILRNEGEPGTQAQEVTVQWRAESGKDCVWTLSTDPGAVEEVEWGAGDNPVYVPQRKSLREWWFGDPHCA